MVRTFARNASLAHHPFAPGGTTPWDPFHISQHCRLIAALGLAFFYYKAVEKESPGNERMVFLMTEIQKGAKAFLQAEYKWVGVFAVAMAILLAVAVIAPLAAVTYLPSVRSCHRPPGTPA